ncbi:hypothetical protein CHISP_2110 [Chitinispirillum alkaliphilum]|nr:hypothetical protein CHISP_2110 [Chitinispirillum alkaliphilum]
MIGANRMKAARLSSTGKTRLECCLAECVNCHCDFLPHLIDWGVIPSLERIQLPVYDLSLGKNGRG